MVSFVDFELKHSRGFRLHLGDYQTQRPLLMLTGGNGSGKTSILHAMAGLLAHRGQVRWHGQPVVAQRRQVGFCLGGLYLPDDWTYADASAFIAFQGRVGAKPSLLQAAEAAFGLGAFARKPLASLSAGMRQKAKLCLMLATDPGLLLVDEPEAHLDEAATQAWLGLVQACLQAGKHLVYATHYPRLLTETIPEPVRAHLALPHGAAVVEQA